jgi:hypothetical protein
MGTNEHRRNPTATHPLRASILCTVDMSFNASHVLNTSTCTGRVAMLFAMGNQRIVQRISSEATCSWFDGCDTKYRVDYMFRYNVPIELIRQDVHDTFGV